RRSNGLRRSHFLVTIGASAELSDRAGPLEHGPEDMPDGPGSEQVPALVALGREVAAVLLAGLGDQRLAADDGDAALLQAADLAEVVGVEHDRGDPERAEHRGGGGV